MSEPDNEAPAGEDLHGEDPWNEFHRVVNMSSRELAEWLRTQSAGPETEDNQVPPMGTGIGHHVLRILGKRRTDLNPEDHQVMRQVVDWVKAQRREDLEPVAGQAEWRHRLMSVGHDPLKPP